MSRFFNLPEAYSPDFSQKVLELYIKQKEMLLILAVPDSKQDRIPRTPDRCDNSNEFVPLSPYDLTERRTEETSPQKRYWTNNERVAFEKAVKYYGYTSARGINSNAVSAFVGTRTPAQVRSHAQKYFMKEQSPNTILTEEDISRFVQISQSKYIRNDFSRSNSC